MFYYMHDNNNYQCKICWSKDPDFCHWFDTTQFSYIPLCSPNIATCKDVFNPNITTFKPNCAEGLHFSAFHLSINLKIYDKFLY